MIQSNNEKEPYITVCKLYNNDTHIKKIKVLRYQTNGIKY